MPLRTVQRVTFSLPKITIKKLEIAIPKSKRSKFISKAIEEKLAKKTEISLEETMKIWDELAGKHPYKGKKTAIEMIREDRASH